MGRSVIVAYTPKPGKEADLLAAVKDHLQILRSQDLVTETAAKVMRASDGTIVEVFEWRSADAIRQAHSNPAVLALWERFGAACDYTSLAKLPEAQQMFAEFDSVDL
jgi:hypothetical protein